MEVAHDHHRRKSGQSVTYAYCSLAADLPVNVGRNNFKQVHTITIVMTRSLEVRKLGVHLRTGEPAAPGPTHMGANFDKATH